MRGNKKTKIRGYKEERLNSKLRRETMIRESNAKKGVSQGDKVTCNF